MHMLKGEHQGRVPAQVLPSRKHPQDPGRAGAETVAEMVAMLLLHPSRYGMGSTRLLCKLGRALQLFSQTPEQLHRKRFLQSAHVTLPIQAQARSQV